jgi:hypothetical protein
VILARRAASDETCSGDINERLQVGAHGPVAPELVVVEGCPVGSFDQVDEPDKPAIPWS